MVAVFLASLMLGETFVGLDEIVVVLTGGDAPGASFTVGRLRLPRSALGALAGLAFGVAGATFQTMLHNPLASPDVLGISGGASAAAVIGIVTLHLDGAEVSMMALGGAVLTAVAMYLLARRGGFVGGRLVLVGIGFAAMLQSVVAYVLSRAAAWDLQTAMRWLTGSLNGATWARIAPLVVACAVCVPALATMQRSLAILSLGDDTAHALGLRVDRTRLLLLVVAVVVLAVATSAAGPVSFVAFMAGPVAARLVGPGAPLVVPAGLVGALLVLTADLAGQHAFDHRYPVGIVTGVLGAPYLLVLLTTVNRSGASA